MHWLLGIMSIVFALLSEEQKPKQNVFHEPIFGPDAPAEEPLDEEKVHLSIYNELVPEKPKPKRNCDEWHFRILCLQNWFIRCSWVNKFLFVNFICQSTAGCYVLGGVLKSIEYIYSKDLLESLSRGCTDYDFDRIPIDDNRTLHMATLNEVMKEDFHWFSKLEPSAQVRVILKLLRLGGGGLIYEIYKSVGRMYKERQEKIEVPSSRELLKAEQESKQKLKQRSKFKMSQIIVGPKSESFQEEDYGLRKLSELSRRNAELLAYKKSRGILGSESKTGRKMEATETVDYLQILPIQVNRKIISYIDEKSLSGLKKVGNYWDKMIDELINEKSGRKAIAGKIDKIGGGKSDKIERNVEELREPELVDCIGEEEIKKIIRKKNPRALAETQKLCQKFSLQYNVKNLDSSFYRDRCGDSDAAAGLLACSGGNNMVYFYSVRTGTRMNFFLYGFESTVTCLTFHEDRIHILVGCADGTIISKDMRDNKTNATFNAHSGAVVAIFSTSSNILSGAKDNTIKYFHLWSGLCLLQVDLNPDHLISALSFRPGPPVWAIVGTSEGELILVDVNARNFIVKVKLHAEAINQIAHTDDFIITGSDWGNVRTWNVDLLSYNAYTRRPYYNVDAESSVTCLFLYKNQIFCGCENGTVKIISLAEGKVLKIIKISSQTSILGIKITEDNFSMKLIIWHEKGIEIRSFPLGKLSSKRKAIGENNRESKQKAPTGTRRNKTSDTVPARFGKAREGPIELGVSFPKRATGSGVKRSTKETCCTLAALRQPEDVSRAYCSDIYTDMLNMYSTESGKSYVFKTFPRYNKS